MRTPFREPEVEESTHAIILQNRCGNRLSLLIGDEATQLEFVYKPNAYRRKEFRARNFSTRDNFTTLFSSFAALELRAPWIRDFGYDPFITRLNTLAPSGARNAITFLNIADENCFAIAARQPLTLAIRPKSAFIVTDGMLMEQFEDRGEQIVSFVLFPSFEANRYRVLDDGTHILQLVENDVVLVGGEENVYHVGRIRKALEGQTLQQLVGRNERLIAPTLGRAAVTVADEAVRRVLDINKRFVHSAIDEGGACFGSIERIYHLIWTRDGSMHTSQYAAAGLPDFLRLWAPFLLNNPATIQEDGRTITAWQQLFGTRWTKSEDDGLYYATWALFTHHVTTGDDSLLDSDVFDALLRAVDDQISTRFDAQRGLFISDTRGESTLASSPYYGYDIVNGKLDPHRIGSQAADKAIARCISLYNNILVYNVLRMLLVLLEQRPEIRPRLKHDYAAMAQRLEKAIDALLLDSRGIYRSEYLFYSDGSEGYAAPTEIDWWEYAWALSLTPFHPNTAAAVTSAREYVQFWPKHRNYGFSPWNTLVALLHEHGLPAAQVRAMLDAELTEALMLTKRYPMPGLLTEYHTDTEGWRGLPFSASSFHLAVTSMLVRPLAQGIAVRAGGLVERIDSFTWAIWRMDITTAGQGAQVASVTVNGQPVPGTLQIPLSYLRPGRNSIEITRGRAPAAPRLYGSTLQLLSADHNADTTTLRFAASPLGEITLENAPAGPLALYGADGAPVEAQRTAIPETNLTTFRFACPTATRLELA